MILSSQFVRWLAEMRGHLPNKTWTAIRNEGRDRLVARLRSGRADGVLDFSDLVERGENAVIK